jgi:tetratricopeptide (TPR) repeat protein
MNGDGWSLTADHSSPSSRIGHGPALVLLNAQPGLGHDPGLAHPVLWRGPVQATAAGDFPGAIGVLQQGLGICRGVGDRLGEAYTLLSLGRAWRATGDLARAAGVLEPALEIFQQVGDQGGEAEVLNETGAVLLARADPVPADDCYRRALKLARATGSRLEEARALEGTGRCAGQPCDATAGALRQALEIYQRLGTPDAARLTAERAAL